jgi:hypothetical protein
VLDKPPGDKLLAAVVQFLRTELMPSLEGSALFKTRVAANVLELVGREFVGRAAIEEAEKARLERILGHIGSLESLNRELCTAIADGRITLQTEGLCEHLWQTTLDKLSIEQPTYASFKHVQAERARPAGKGGDR